MKSVCDILDKEEARESLRIAPAEKNDELTIEESSCRSGKGLGESTPVTCVHG